MPTTIRTSEPIEVLFQKLIEARGLDTGRMPAAVQMTVHTLSNGTAPFAALLEDLPASARAWDWMSCVFAAYAEWCDGTIVSDVETS